MTPAAHQNEVSSPTDARKTACTHSRVIDEVRTSAGTGTGQLVCLECKSLLPASPVQPR